MYRKFLEVTIFMLVTWLAFFVFQVTGIHVAGIVPRDTSSLHNVIFLPFIHYDFFHVLSNTVVTMPLLLGLYLSCRYFWFTLFKISVSGAFLLWCFGRQNSHIGMSVLSFGLISYLVFAGFRHKNLSFKSAKKAFKFLFLYGTFKEFKGTGILGLLIALAVLFSYSLIVFNGIVMADSQISWDGHLFGFVAGAFLGMTEGRDNES